MNYSIENKDLINKRKNIARINGGYFVSKEIIKQYNISYDDIKNKNYIHRNIDFNLLKSIQQQGQLTKKQQEEIEHQEVFNNSYNINKIKLNIESYDKIQENTGKQYISKLNTMMTHFNEVCLLKTINNPKFDEYIQTTDNSLLILSALLILIESFEFNADKDRLRNLMVKQFSKKKELDANKIVNVSKTFQDLVDIKENLGKLNKNSYNYLFACLFLGTHNLFRAELYNCTIDYFNDNETNIYNPTTNELYLNKFKNSHKKKKEVVKLSDDFLEAIGISLEYQPRKELFKNFTYKLFLALCKSTFGITFQMLRRIIETSNYNTMPAKDFILNCKSHSPYIAVTHYVGG